MKFINSVLLPLPHSLLKPELGAWGYWFGERILVPLLGGVLACCAEPRHPVFSHFTKLHISSPIISKVLSELDFFRSFRVGTLFPFHPGILTPLTLAPVLASGLSVKMTGGVFWALPRDVLALVTNYSNSRHFCSVIVIDRCLLPIMTPSSGHRTPAMPPFPLEMLSSHTPPPSRQSSL